LGQTVEPGLQALVMVLVLLLVLVLVLLLEAWYLFQLNVSIILF
jgi:hypothetical protein